MSLVEVNFISKSLMRTVTFQAIIPLDKLALPGQEIKVKPPFKTLYLLHGGYGNQMDYITGTRIQRWAEALDLAVIMPAGDNQFYVDKEDTEEYYGRYVGQELVEFTRVLFPLSDKREDTFIAGLSMGGYGALINGLKYSDTFGYIGGFSAGLLLNDILNETELIKGLGWPSTFYDRVLGKKDTLLGSDKDYCFLVDELKRQQKEIPCIFLSIGKNDFLYKQNQDFRSFLSERNVKYVYEEGEGSHEWDFWDKCLKSFLNWLPLEEGEEGINSGNVRRAFGEEEITL